MTNNNEETCEKPNRSVTEAYDWLMNSDNFDCRNLVQVIKSQMKPGVDCFDLRGAAKVLVAFLDHIQAPPQAIEKPKPEPKKWQPTCHVPATLEEAVQILTNPLNVEEKQRLAKDGVAGLHFTAGMNIRNQWGLWHDSVLAQHFKTRFGLGHADDMSGMILACCEADVRDEVFDADAKAEYYRNYWREQGIDPLTQEKM